MRSWMCLRCMAGNAKSGGCVRQAGWIFNPSFSRGRIENPSYKAQTQIGTAWRQARRKENRNGWFDNHTRHFSPCAGEAPEIKDRTCPPVILVGKGWENSLVLDISRSLWLNPRGEVEKGSRCATCCAESGFQNLVAEFARIQRKRPRHKNLNSCEFSYEF